MTSPHKDCTWQQIGSGGGEWLCPHHVIAVAAYYLHEQWVEESKWSPGALDPGPEFFWYEAVVQLREA